jgi:energy-converting hydrogenase Eha subunit F
MTPQEIQLLTKIVTNSAGQDDFYAYSRNITTIAKFLSRNAAMLKKFNIIYETTSSDIENPEGIITEIDIFTKGALQISYELRILDPIESLFYEVL